MRTVGDLATSPVFADAAAVAGAQARGDAEALRRLAEALSRPDADVDAERFASAPIDALRAIPADRAGTLRAVFPDIAALAAFEGFAAARAMTTAEEQAPTPDEREGVPDELVPRARAYATSRETIVRTFIDRFGEPGATTPDVDVRPLWRLSLEDARRPPDTGVALGARLTLEKSSTPEGIALGRLLHSLPLAPGESANIAIVAFDRRAETLAAERLGEVESASARLGQEQDASATVGASVEENQSGETVVDSVSTARSGSVAAGVAGVKGPVILGAGATGTRARTTTDTTVTTSSHGVRDADLTTAETLLRQTDQEAAAQRDRDATLVTEVRETEGSRAETRNVTNYNHMHALSVHYYEVVQIHRVEVRAVSAEALLFVPFAPVDFTDPELVAQHRRALRAAADSPRVRALIDGLDGALLVRRAGGAAPTDYQDAPDPDALLRLGVTGSVAAGEFRIPAGARIAGIEFSSVGAENLFLAIPRRARFVGRDGAVVEVTLPGRDADPARSHRPVAGAVPASPALRTLARLDLDFGSDGVWQAPIAAFRLTLEREGRIAFAPFAARVVGRGVETALTVAEDAAFAAVVAELQRDPARYGAAIYRDLGPETLGGLFVGRSFAGLDLGVAVEPVVAASFGPLLGFPVRIPEGQEGPLGAWWADWRARNYHPEQVRAELVATGTGGVHAEAVLGRANAAEKLDFTRFWNWQDSPIPNAAPRIADVTTESRSQLAAAPVPGQFGQPIVSIQTPPAFPSPIDAGAAFAEFLKAQPFRDMSGSDVAGAVAATGMQEAGKLAAESVRAAAGMVGALAPQATALRTAADAAARTTSERAAAYNEARKLEAEGGAGSAGDAEAAGEEEQDGSGADPGAAGEAAREGIAGAVGAARGAAAGSGVVGAAARHAASLATGILQAVADPTGRHDATASAEAARRLAEATAMTAREAARAVSGPASDAAPRSAAPTTARFMAAIGPDVYLLMNFATGSPELLPTHVFAIEELFAPRIKASGPVLQIEGLASLLGRRTENEALAKRRAQAVFDALSKALQQQNLPPLEPQTAAVAMRWGPDASVRKRFPGDPGLEETPGAGHENDPAQRGVLLFFDSTLAPG